MCVCVECDVGDRECIRRKPLCFCKVPIHDFKRNKDTALAVLKKYTRNDDREVLEDAYSNAASKYLAMPIPTIEGIRTILTELSSTVAAAKNADPEQFVSYKIAREIEASGFIKRLYEK